MKTFVHNFFHFKTLREREREGAMRIRQINQSQ